MAVQDKKKKSKKVETHLLIYAKIKSFMQYKCRKPTLVVISEEIFNIIKGDRDIPPGKLTFCGIPLIISDEYTTDHNIANQIYIGDLH